MAKAKEITGLDCAADALLWAAEVLRVRFDEIVGLREAALDFSDIEGVHGMRVATRRLRSALRDFAPLMKGRLPKRLRKDLKAIADALGAVRDQDVAIVALGKLRAEEADDETVKAGIGKFIEQRSETRAIARLKLAEAVAASRVEDLQERFGAAVGKSLSRKKSKSPTSFNEAGRAVVAHGWRDLYDLGASLYEPFNVEEQHEMRIAAKRLRYALELFAACWGERIAPFAGEISEMQSFLGEVHDCDVWIEDLSNRLRHDAESAAAGGEHQTAVWLLSEFVKKRAREYRSALALWGEWQASRFSERMRAVIESPPDDAPPAARRSRRGRQTSPK